MENQQLSKNGTPRDLIYCLRKLQSQEADADIIVESAERYGVIHMRKGIVVSANSDILHGNGAVLSLARVKEPNIEVRNSIDSMQKTISLTLSQIQKIVASQKAGPATLTGEREVALLEDAKKLFFQFHHKLAGEKLITILRSNRFFYPAWLWQSRIITRMDYIGKAIDEAYRWGNHDQEIWREARKIRPQLDNSTETVKRCHFCWSILRERGQCPHCHSFLVITSQPQSEDLRHEELRYSLSMLDAARTQDPSNARIAYSLSVGYFNLKEYQQSLQHMRLAAKLAPSVGLYSKSLSLLTAVARTQTQLSISSQARTGKATGSTILLVEDSQTSRRVLSMLLNRHGYQVLEASNGAQALQICASSQPNMVILDVVLPDTTGHQRRPQIKAAPRMNDVPVIMLTGKQTTEDRLQGINGGVSEYVTKPFNPEKLLRLVQNYLPSPATPPQYETRHSTGPAAAPPASAAKKAKAAIPTIDKNKKTIFVVEDSPTSRKVLKMILSRNNFNVVEAANGREALEIAADLRPHLMLLDIMLPDMTGYEILPQIKDLNHFDGVPVFMLTGKRAPSDKMKGMLLGSNEYITKPFNPEKLMSLINNYI